jgi:hypothetical protein
VCKAWINVHKDTLAQLGFDEVTNRTQLEQMGSYCRNPGAVRSRPWCYVYNPYTLKEEWEMCEAAICEQGMHNSDTGLQIDPSTCADFQAYDYWLIRP